MNFIQSIFLGFIQGITEFLPISSSAHLILTSKILQWQDQGLIFDIALHFGSLLAVIIYFNKDVVNLIKGLKDLVLFKKSDNRFLALQIIIATIPIVIIGAIFHNLAETLFRECIIIIAITSIIWAILLYFADKRPQLKSNIKNITLKDSFIIGIAQALAIIPGTSRSGATMAVARFLNISRQNTAKISMLMAIPVIFLMAMVQSLDLYLSPQSITFEYQYLLIGIISSFIFALTCIHLLIKLVNKVGFLPFVIYRIILGLFILYFI